MWRVAWIGILTSLLFCVTAPGGFLQSHGQAQTLPAARAAAIQRFKGSLAGRGRLKRDRATGLIDFVRLDRAARGSLINWGATPSGKSLAFLRLMAPSAFIHNGYNTTLFPAARGYQYLYNPRAGQPAFSGVDGGSIACMRVDLRAGL